MMKKNEPKYKVGDYVILKYPQNLIDEYGSGGEYGKRYRITELVSAPKGARSATNYLLEGVVWGENPDGYEVGSPSDYCDIWLEPVDEFIQAVIDSNQDD